MIPLLYEADSLKIEPMTGVISLNNTNYRVEADGQLYFLRIGNETARYLGIQWESEIESAIAGARVGVGPEILYDSPSGVMLMPFIAGRSWEPAKFHESQNLQRIAETLRTLHSVTSVNGSGSQFERIEILLTNASNLGATLPSDLDRHREKLAAIAQTRSRDPRFRPCLAHNDLWANNFLDDGNRLYLVDWEFSGLGDGLIDLATISMAGGLSEEEQSTLLHAYGMVEPDDLNMLQSMKWVVTFFEGTWALVMHALRVNGICPVEIGNEFDYQRHANAMFERLQ